MTQNEITLIAAISSSVLTVGGGIGWTIWSARSGRLVWYVTPAQSMTIPIEGGDVQHVQTGVLILKNRSPNPLKNVVVAHSYTGWWYTISPPLEKRDIQLTLGTSAFQFPSMPARGQLTITYCSLQQTPGNVLEAIYSDEGEGKNVSFSFQRQVSTWQRRMLNVLAIAGAASLLFWLISFILTVLGLRGLLR